MTELRASPRRTLQLSALRRAYLAGGLTATALVDDLVERLAAHGDPAVWITCVDEASLRRRAGELDALAAQPGAVASLPLFGIPFAVKDNIDAAGLPTTAGCPAFTYHPTASAPVVRDLLAAGAILVGKTNLDQFATGLVGTRSPYGVARNVFDAAYIPGGSSSGSAVAVAAGLVSFSLGTDTAGSGRVPAAFGNIVGLKPTPGLVSTRGVVPACRSIDCVSIFALTVADAMAVLDVAAGFDPEDPFSRPAPSASAARDGGFRFGVLAADDLEFFGDRETARLCAAAVQGMKALGGIAVEVPFAPFHAVGQLLYNGPWVAERMVASERLLSQSPDAILPITRGIIESGRRYTALDAFRASYELGALKRQSAAILTDLDFLLLPTAGTIYRLDEIAAEPLQRNANLGLYTTFVNLLDLAAIAVPAGFRGDGMPAGVSLIGPAFSDHALAAHADRLARHLSLPLGATGATADETTLVAAPAAPEFALAVVGAHMSGMALNGELQRLGARLVAKTRTASCYRMFLLAGTPARPGLLRVANGDGAALEAEVWALDAAAFGRFVAAVPPPLSIGSLRLADGSVVKGFLCEAAATVGARDISDTGSWRRFVAGG
ncbi:MAG: gatA [Rhodospirillales bacterium]|nr:gatA [Rhodospirillales bacterium]